MHATWHVLLVVEVDACRIPTGTLAVSLLQKLAHITAASEEERRRIETAYKDRLAAADEKLRALRHKEREFVQMQKLKHQTEVGMQQGSWGQVPSHSCWPLVS